MKHLLSAAFLVASFTVFHTLAQERPTLEVFRSAQGIRVQWGVGQTAPSTQVLKFQLEQSADLQSWSPLGVPVRSAATGEIVSRELEPGAEKSFYRVAVSPEERNTALANGGEDVFGYSDLFQQALANVGQITPQQFAERYDPKVQYLGGIDWDPTEAEFWTAFNTNPQQYNSLLIPMLDDLRQFDFRLNQKELALFKKNGFVVSERLGAQSVGEIYNRLWIDDLPVFITTDSLLHAWHRSYDMMLAEIEQSLLFGNIRDMLAGMAAKIKDVEPQVNEVMRESLLDADYFITVARSLLSFSSVPSSLGQDARVDRTLQKISGEQLDMCFDLFGEPRAVDFSQFKPRGHYADRYSQLPMYFRAVMWLGRIDLRIAGGPFEDSLCPGATPGPRKARPRELGTAIVLEQLLRESGHFERWQQSEEMISTFVGWTDSMTFRGLGAVLREAGINTVADVKDMDVLTGLQARLESGALGAQAINGDVFISPLGGPPAVLPRSFTVFGQKFVVDSWALSQLVADRVLWVENGETNKVQRRMPSALDVAFSVLRNDQVVPNLVARMTDATAATSTNYPVRFRDGLNYQHNLSAVREVVEQHPASAWNRNIYMNWVDTLRQISEPIATDLRMPTAMRSRAWAMKDLNTQLASWTELRHDTILYAKPSYTDGFVCSYPKGFIEPRPTFWRRMQLMAQNTAALITRTDYGGQTNLQQKQVEFLKHFAGVSKMLLDMSEKELRQEPFTDAEVDFISSTLVGFRSYAGYWTVKDGWYPKLFYHTDLLLGNPMLNFDQRLGSTRWDPLVADVHTDVPCGICGDPGGVLHEATGNVNLLMVAIDNGKDRCVYAGPVLSHYEFEIVGEPQRLGDDDWQIRLAKAGLADQALADLQRYRGNDWSGIPKAPEWTREYLVEQRP